MALDHAAPDPSGMTTERNPQATQMADESMVRNLAAQAEAIWPQERPVLLRERLPRSARVLDLGCGTGELTRRIARELPDAHVTGVDVHAPHLELARSAAGDLSDRVEFREGDAFELDLADDTFDLTIYRHLFQAITHPERVLAEMTRVTRPGGIVHVAAEDYGMIHFHPTTRNLDLFFHRGPCVFAERTGSDLLNGRKAPTMFHLAGLVDVSVDYIAIDTIRVPRPVLLDIFTAWRDGYAEGIAENSELELDEVLASFEEMLNCLRLPEGYAVWQLPIVRGRVPDPSR